MGEPATEIPEGLPNGLAATMPVPAEAQS
jgi:hypothetical protein